VVVNQHVVQRYLFEDRTSWKTRLVVFFSLLLSRALHQCTQWVVKKKIGLVFFHRYSPLSIPSHDSHLTSCPSLPTYSSRPHELHPMVNLHRPLQPNPSSPVHLGNCKPSFPALCTPASPPCKPYARQRARSHPVFFPFYQTGFFLVFLAGPERRNIVGCSTCPTPYLQQSHPSNLLGRWRPRRSVCFRDLLQSI
jgi:hypothetical protein